MSVTAKLAPPNSLVLLCGVGRCEIPKSMQGALILATSSCVAVSCLSEHDGETTFTLGPSS